MSFATNLTKQGDSLWAVFESLEWLGRNADAIGICYPATLPSLEIQHRTSFPNRERVRPHVEFLASLIQAVGQGDAKAKPPLEQREKRMTIDQRMKLMLFDKPESSGWSITEFETELKCSRAGIHKTASWKALDAARKLGKAERRNDRRAKTR